MTTNNRKATMIIPKNGEKIWTDLMQTPKPLPAGVSEGELLVASYAKFPDGTMVVGGIAAGTKDYNYPLFIVFDSDYNRVVDGGIDPGDWEDFYVTDIDFSLTTDGELYTLTIEEDK